MSQRCKFFRWNYLKVIEKMIISQFHWVRNFEKALLFRNIWVKQTQVKRGFGSIGFLKWWGLIEEKNESGTSSYFPASWILWNKVKTMQKKKMNKGKKEKQGEGVRTLCQRPHHEAEWFELGRPSDSLAWDKIQETQDAPSVLEPIPRESSISTAM